MPTYEYVCKSCGENIEVFQSFNSRPLKKHAGCGGELKKIFHARGVVFKGSGFYKNDSRTGSSGDKSEKSEKGESSKSSEKGESPKASKSENGKSDSKKAASASKDSSSSSAKD
jgi:putative FmdB family regulatory protein